MITEIQFSRAFISLWAELAPASEQFTRRVNSQLYERFDAPLTSAVNSSRRGLVNDAAFRYFCLRFQNDQDGEDAINQALEQALQWAGLRSDQYDGASGLVSFSEDEIAEVKSQAHRLENFFCTRWPRDQIVLKPIFQGCGIVDACEGDVLAGNILYEVKAGDRPYRSIDIRQLLTYVTLSKLMKSYQIESIGLINPRLGTYFEMSVEDVCEEISGLGAIELIARIAYSISSGDVSR